MVSSGVSRSHLDLVSLVAWRWQLGNLRHGDDQAFELSDCFILQKMEHLTEERIGVGPAPNPSGGRPL